MSKLRRQRKTRTRVDRIDGRSLACEMSLRSKGMCRHGPVGPHGALFLVFKADEILRSSGPSENDLASLACIRTRKVISHPMTQLYKLVDPGWFEDILLYLSSDFCVQPRGWKVWARRRRLVFLAGMNYRRLSASLNPDAANGPRDEYSIGNSRRRSRRLRRKLRQMRAAKLRDKYGRQRS